MNAHFWAVDFPRMYVGLFEIAFGIVMLAIPQIFFDPTCSFRREVHDPVVGARFRAVLTQRQTIEAIPMLPWRLTGCVGIVLGYLAASGRVEPVVSYALFCLAISVVTTAIFLRMRNRGERRAASLSPRTVASNAPRWLYATAIVDVLTLLPFVSDPKLGPSAALVAGVSAMLIVSAFVANGMAAMLTGSDAEVEVIVEDRLRCTRVSVPLIFAAAVPVVFFGMGVHMRLQPVQSLAYYTCIAIWLCVFAWWMLLLFRKARVDEGVFAH